MQNILITGSNGQLGQTIKKLAANFDKCNFYFTDVNELDITSEDKISAYCKQYKIGVIVNCAAYTAVDKAESDRDNAHLLKVQAIKNLVIQANNHGASFINISTDYLKK